MHHTIGVVDELLRLMCQVLHRLLDLVRVGNDAGMLARLDSATNLSELLVRRRKEEMGLGMGMGQLMK
jgi:hypothetical protein